MFPSIKNLRFFFIHTNALFGFLLENIPQFHDYFTLIGVQIFNVYEVCFPPHVDVQGGVCSLLCFVNNSSC